MQRYPALLFLVFTLCSFFSATIHAQPLIEIEEFQWTDSVDSHTRQYGAKLSSPIQSKKVYLWMKLKVSDKLLEKLRETPDGELPVRHEWFKYVADYLRADIDVTIPLSVGRKEDLQKLSYEVDSRGYAFWRIWSMKSHLSKGWWRVDVLDASGNPLHCVDKETQKPCSFKIEVR